MGRADSSRTSLGFEPTAVHAVSGAPPTKLGRYRLCFELAVGGMASVYLARAEGAAGFEKFVALKTIHPHLARERAFVEMFLDEARIASMISHPNVCSVFDFGVEQGVYFIAMEYLLGEPLSRCMEAVIDRQDAGDAERLPFYAARVIADACEGLHAAHELRGPDGVSLGVVHRDVSPQNLFVTYDGSVKVVDFGVAKAVERVSKTEAGTVKGKVGYVAPEQVRGVAQVDRRADVWALGVCLWETLTLQRLFRRDTDLRTVMAVIEDEIPPPSRLAPHVPPELDAIVMRALARTPDERYPTARALGRDLRKFITQSGQTVDAAELGEWMEELVHADRERAMQLLELARTAPPIGQVAAASVALQALESNRPPAGMGATPAAGTAGGETHGATGIVQRPSSVWVEEGDDGGSIRPPRSRTGLWAWVLVIVLLGGGAAGAYWYMENVVVRRGAHHASRARTQGSTSASGTGASGTATSGQSGHTNVVTPPVVALDAGAATSATNTPAALDAGPAHSTTAGSRAGSGSHSGEHAQTVRVSTRVTQRRTTASTASGEQSAEGGETGSGGSSEGGGTTQGSGGEENAPPAHPGTGTLRIMANGGWSQVFLGDRDLGRTPLTVELPEGTHQLRILPFGEEPGNMQSVRVYEGIEVTVNVGIRVGQ